MKETIYLKKVTVGGEKEFFFVVSDIYEDVSFSFGFFSFSGEFKDLSSGTGVEVKEKTREISWED